MEGDTTDRHYDCLLQPPKCSPYFTRNRESGFSLEEEDVISRLELILKPQAEAVRTSFGGSPLNEKIFKCTCKLLGKALCKLRSTCDSVNIFIEDPLLLVDVFEMAYIFSSLYDASWSFEAYQGILINTTPGCRKDFKNPDFKNPILENIETSSNQSLGGVGKEFTEVIENIFKMNEEDLGVAIKRVNAEYNISLENSSDGKVEELVDKGKAPPDNIDRAVKGMFDQAGGSTSHDDDIEEPLCVQMANLCSVVESIIEYPMTELEMVATFLQHFTEFLPLVEQLKMLTKDDVRNYLFEGWENPSSFLQDQSLSELVSVDSEEQLELKWTLRILKETVSQIIGLSCYGFPEELSHSLYVEIVTGEKEHMIHKLSFAFAFNLTCCGITGNTPKCHDVLGKIMHKTVRYHKWLKKKFLVFRQELIERGEPVYLDAEAYDAILYLVACLRDAQLDLKHENSFLSNKIKFCGRIYKGLSVDRDMAIFSIKQNESVMGLLRTVAMFRGCVDPRIPDSETIAIRSLLAEIELQVLVKRLGKSAECNGDESPDD